MIVRLERSGGWHEREQERREVLEADCKNLGFLGCVQMGRGDWRDGGGEIGAIYMRLTVGGGNEEIPQRLNAPHSLSPECQYTKLNHQHKHYDHQHQHKHHDHSAQTPSATTPAVEYHKQHNQEIRNLSTFNCLPVSTDKRKQI